MNEPLTPIGCFVTWCLLLLPFYAYFQAIGIAPVTLDTTPYVYEIQYTDECVNSGARETAKITDCIEENLDVIVKEVVRTVHDTLSGKVTATDYIIVSSDILGDIMIYLPELISVEKGDKFHVSGIIYRARYTKKDTNQIIRHNNNEEWIDIVAFKNPKITRM